MLKKPVLDFFNHDLAGVNPSKSHKLLDFSSLAIGNPSMDCVSRLFFNSLLMPHPVMEEPFDYLALFHMPVDYVVYIVHGDLPVPDALGVDYYRR